MLSKLGFIPVLLAALGLYQVQASGLSSFQKLSLELFTNLIFDGDGEVLDETSGNTSKVSWNLVSSRESAYGAVGVLLWNGSFPYCNATLIRSTDNPVSPAYAITAAHCVNDPRPTSATPLLAPGEVQIGKPLPVTLRLNHFVDSQKQFTDVHVRRAVYASTNGTDLAILELKITVGALAKAGLKGLRLSKALPKANDSAVFVGTPLDLIPEPQRYLHKSTCAIRGLFNVTAQVMNMRGAVIELRQCIHHNCSAVGGNSGSPLLSATTGEIVGVMSWVEKLQRRAEALPDDFTRRFEGYNGAVPVSEAASCFNKRGVFDVQADACLLEAPCTGLTAGECAAEQCANGRARACFEAAAAVLEQNEHAAREGISFFEDGCGLGDAESCAYLADLYKTGGLFRQSFAKSAELHLKACQLGNAESCLTSAWFFGTGNGVEKSSERAVAQYRQACSMGHPFACERLADAAANEGFLPRSAQLFAKACLSGSNSACAKLAGMYEAGRGVSESVVNAVQVLSWACEMDDGTACFKAGQILKSTTSDVKSTRRATGLLRKACNLGMKQAC